MRNNTRSIHVRFNLDKPEQNKAWAYLMDFDRNQFGSYNQFMAKAIIDAVEKKQASECPLDADACEMVNRCVRKIVSSVEDVLIRTLPSYVAGCFAASTRNVHIKHDNEDTLGMADDNPDNPEQVDRENEIDWEYLGR